MSDALYDLGETVVGRNSAMQWSLDPAILRRQIVPVFKRCAEGDITAEVALDIAMDFAVAGMSNNMEVLTRQFNKVHREIGDEFNGKTFPSLGLMQELVLGLNSEMEWATNHDITRREMYPMFVRLAVGRAGVTDCVRTFCDQISAKSDYYFEYARSLTGQLAEEIVNVSRSREESTNGDS